MRKRGKNVHLFRRRLRRIQRQAKKEDYFSSILFELNSSIRNSINWNLVFFNIYNTLVCRTNSPLRLCVYGRHVVEFYMQGLKWFLSFTLEKILPNICWMECHGIQFVIIYDTIIYHRLVEVFLAETCSTLQYTRHGFYLEFIIIFSFAQIMEIQKSFEWDFSLRAQCLTRMTHKHVNNAFQDDSNV